MEAVTNVWNPAGILIAVLLLTTRHLASGSRACPTISGTANYPVINMCEVSNADNSNILYLDAFSNSTTTSMQCICFLQARGPVQIGFQQNIISGVPCQDTVTLYSDATKDHRFGCGDDSASLTMTAESSTMVIELKTTSASGQESAYCLQISKQGGTGTLKLQCQNPVVKSTTSSPTGSSTPAPISSSSPTPISSSSPTPIASSSPTPISSSSPTSIASSSPTPIASSSPTPISSSISTSDSTLSTEREKASTLKSTEKQVTDAFPVEAVAIGVVAGVLMIVILICAICIGFRRRDKHPYERHDSNNVSVSRTMTPVSSNQLEGVSVSGPVEPSQSDIQYVNFPTDGEDEGSIPTPTVDKPGLDFTLVDEVACESEQGDIEGMYASVTKSSMRSKQIPLDTFDVDQSETAPDLPDQLETVPDLPDQSETVRDFPDQSEKGSDVLQDQTGYENLSYGNENDLSKPSEMSVYGVDQITHNNPSVSFLAL